MITLSARFQSFAGCAYGLNQPVVAGDLRLSKSPEPEGIVVLLPGDSKPSGPLSCRRNWEQLSMALDTALTALLQKAWKQGMLSEEQAITTPSSPANDGTQKRALVERLLFWTSTLQKAAGLPVFVTGAIVQERSLPSGDHEFRVAMPSVHHGSTAQCLTLVVRAFNDLCRQAGGDGAASLSEDTEAAIMKELKGLTARAPSGSNTSVFLHAAHERDIPWRNLAGNIYEFGYGSRCRWLDSTFTDRTPNLSAVLARNKIATAHVLRRAGLPVPRHGRADSPEKAALVARKLGFPVVVKPMDLDRGKGVAAGLQNETSVRKAFEAARTHSAHVIVEKHVSGRDYRLTVFQGALVKAVHRVPGGVTGDGESSVAELVRVCNADPRRGRMPTSPLKILDLDEEALELLDQEGLSPDSILPDGRFMALRRSANISCGGTPLDVIGQVHPDNRRLAEAAATALRLDLAGIDLIIPDISRSWHEAGGTICEVNAQPQLGTVTGPHLYGLILETLLGGTGRIPIVFIMGGSSGEALAHSIQRRLASSGLRTGRASGKGLWAGDSAITRGTTNFFLSGLALLVNPEVDAAVITTHPAEVIRLGLPFDGCDVMILTDPLETPGTETPHSEALDLALRLAAPHCRGTVIFAEHETHNGDRTRTGQREMKKLLEGGGFAKGQTLLSCPVDGIVEVTLKALKINLSVPGIDGAGSNTEEQRS